MSKSIFEDTISVIPSRNLLEQFRKSENSIFFEEKKHEEWKPPLDIPNKLDSFIGQDNIKNAIEIALIASCKENRSLDHMLFYGPPGFGKTKVSQLIIDTLKVPCMRLTGKAISKSSEFIYLVNFIQNSEPFSVVFIDELHCISKSVAEELFSMMQDFTYRDDKIQQFTLLGATTDIGLISKPLRDRFKYLFKFSKYSINELKLILRQKDPLLEENVVNYLVNRCKGTPRILLGYYDQARNVAIYEDKETIDMTHCVYSMKLAGIDENGMTPGDIEFLAYLRDIGKPVGKSTLAMALNIPESDLINIIEPWLLQQQLIIRTARGREITNKGRQLLRVK